MTELGPDSVDRLGLERARSPRESGYRSWAVDADLADAQLGDHGQASDVGEAERAADIDLILASAFQRGPHEFDLALDGVDQGGLVASRDHQHLATFGEQSADVSHAHLPAMRFGVDHGNAPGANRDVVDVRAAVSRYAPVVQQLDPLPMEDLGESSRGAHLAGSARFQVLVLWGSSVMRTITAPRRPRFSRACCSRRCSRRACSRDALAPASPSTIVASLASQPRHVTAFDARSQMASSPAARLSSQTTQRSARRRRSRFLEAESSIPDHRQNPTHSQALLHNLGSMSISLRGPDTAEVINACTKALTDDPSGANPSSPATCLPVGESDSATISSAAAKLSAVADVCVVCGSERHSRAYACVRCKRILDRVEMRRDASGALRRFDRDARLQALRQSWRDGAFRCYYTGISLIASGDRWPDHRYRTFEHRTPGDETSVVDTCALVNRMKTDLTGAQFKAMVFELRQDVRRRSFRRGCLPSESLDGLRLTQSRQTAPSLGESTSRATSL